MTFATHSEINQSMRPHLFFPSPSAFFAVHRPTDRHALSNTLSLSFSPFELSPLLPLSLFGGGRDIHRRPILLEGEGVNVKCAHVEDLAFSGEK